MKKILSLLVLGAFTIYNFNASGQTNKKTSFSKENAYTWLNAKLELEPNDFGTNKNSETETRSSKFTSCSFILKIRRIKVLWPSPNKELYSNVIRANLSELNPNSLKIQSVTDEYNEKFWVVAQTTNSVKVVKREILGSNGELEESRKEANIWIGPFPNNLDDETKIKIKSVIKQLITACGGKDDLF